MIRDLAATSLEMLAVFDDDALVAAALAFEAALAKAQAEHGLIPAAHAEIIAAACTGPVDTDALAFEAAHAGTLAIPLVKRLREAVGAEAAKSVHLGATSQDVADTALSLQGQEAVDLIERDGAALMAGLLRLAETHAATPMLGRTLLQGALPITFGLKASSWLLGVDNAMQRLGIEAGDALALQFGGAAGTLAGLDGKGRDVAETMAETLDLHLPPTPWHSRRDAIAGLGSALAILIGAIGKIARDLSLLAQGEVAEAFEPRVDGRGGSSAMAHKRNPTGCQVALAAAARAPQLAASLIAALPQEHERGLGGWQAEAPVLIELFKLAHGSLAAMVPVIAGLEVDTAAMARNLAAAKVGDDVGEAEAMVAMALAAFEADLEPDA